MLSTMSISRSFSKKSFQMPASQLDMRRRKLMPPGHFDLYGESGIIAGEPLHDFFKLRSLTSVFASDTFDMLLGHKDALLRLSPAPFEACDPRPREPPALPNLTPRAIELLGLAVRQEDVQLLVKDFLQHPLVREAPAWRSNFHATPPRTTLQRLANAVGATLHTKNQGHGYQTNDEFRVEIQNILACLVYPWAEAEAWHTQRYS